MTLDHERLLNWQIPSDEHHYSEKDVILYALGLGLGLRADDAHALCFVYEDQLKILPTQSTVLGYSGLWMSDPETGIDWQQLLHGEQGLRIHRPLAVTGHVVGHTRVDALVDKGPGKNALLYSTRELYDGRDGGLLCTLTYTHVLRGQGGFGGPSGPTGTPVPLPTNAPEIVRWLPTSRQTALIYRLSGDRHQLHVDPAVARTAGFAQPILHGLASFGIAGYGVLSHFCAADPARLKSINVRFASPVYPGETLRLEMWHPSPDKCLFRCRAAERDVIVLDNGWAELHPWQEGYGSALSYKNNTE